MHTQRNKQTLTYQKTFNACPPHFLHNAAALSYSFHILGIGSLLRKCLVTWPQDREFPYVGERSLLPPSSPFGYPSKPIKFWLPPSYRTLMSLYLSDSNSILFLIVFLSSCPAIPPCPSVTLTFAILYFYSFSLPNICNISGINLWTIYFIALTNASP